MKFRSASLALLTAGVLAVSRGHVMQQAAPVVELPFGPGPVQLIDSSGLVWEVTFDPLLSVPGTFLVRGFRDILAQGGCPQPVEVFGSFAGGVLSVTIFDSASDPCVSAHLVLWRAPGGLVGSWVNETGTSGSFWLVRYEPGQAVSRGADPDPQNARR